MADLADDVGFAALMVWFVGMPIAQAGFVAIRRWDGRPAYPVDWSAARILRHQRWCLVIGLLVVVGWITAMMAMVHSALRRPATIPTSVLVPVWLAAVVRPTVGLPLFVMVMNTLCWLR